MIIQKNLIPDEVKPMYVVNDIPTILPMKPKYIAIHETGNTARGANANAHANLQSFGNPRQASWHIQVDDDVAIQSLPFDECGMHAGDGLGIGNMQSIAIEICIASDDNYNKAVQNASEVVKQLMKEFNIPIQNVRQHHSFSGKNCPQRLRSGEYGVTWIRFIEMITYVKPVPKPKPTPPSLTESIVNYMVSKGMDSSFSNRSRLARVYGIRGYRGTASQNTALLQKLRAPKPALKLQNTESIVDFLNANKMNSSFGARRALAYQHGIKGYLGTASQNSKLLELLKKK